MAFYGRNFVFNGIASENYNITISSSEGDDSSKVGDVELMTTKLYKRPVEFLYGVTQSPVMQFPIIFNTPSELTAEEFGLTSAWLFGQQTFQKLQILQEDMSNTYFNCFLIQPEVVRTGNIITGIKAMVRCDSPFAWTFPTTKTYTYGSPPSASSIVFDNFSHDNAYLFPSISFTMTGAGGNLSITNVTDTSRVFTFTGLAANEVITVDNDLQIITSSLSLLRLSKFNLNFFRFLKGRNTLSVTGAITSLSFTYSFAKKIGG